MASRQRFSLTRIWPRRFFASRNSAFALSAARACFSASGSLQSTASRPRFVEQNDRWMTATKYWALSLSSLSVIAFVAWSREARGLPFSKRSRARSYSESLWRSRLWAPGA